MSLASASLVSGILVIDPLPPFRLAALVAELVAELRRTVREDKVEQKAVEV